VYFSPASANALPGDVSDLWESGAIEQDADLIGFLWADEKENRHRCGG
jgi:replicative DNA helicase